MAISSVLYSSESEMWETPKELFKRLDKEFHFTTDVCAIEENAKCENYFSSVDDGLQQDWKGICWMNPPYGKEILKWMQKAYESSCTGAVVVCLVPSRTDTKWWHLYAMRASEIRFIRGRLKFGNSKNSAPFPSAVLVFKEKKKTTDDIKVSSMERTIE